jgi:rod shape-determining protein MreC
MSSLERRTRPRSTGTFLALCAVMLVLAMVTQQPWAAGLRGEAKSLLAPLEAAMTGLEDRAGTITAGFGDVAGLRAENQRLEQENANLQRQIAELQADGLDNAALRQALDFQRSYGHSTVAAEVVAGGPDGLSAAVEIDRGSADGVRAGMVVVTGAGLVGRVSEVGEHAALVETLADTQSRVNAFLSKSGLEGTVSGGPAALEMDLDPRFGIAPAVGEFAITSGVGGGYPRGLVIAQVTSVDHNAAATLDHASLAWVNDPASLSVVLVITDFAGT